jgi:hypothetical protein
MGITGDAPPNELPATAGAAGPARGTVRRRLREGAEAARPPRGARHRLLRERVEQAVRHWDGWEAAVERGAPPADRPPRPPLTRRALQELRVLLLQPINRTPAPAPTRSGIARRGPTEPGT